jgi:hypothetical protein
MPRLRSPLNPDLDAVALYTRTCTSRQRSAGTLVAMALLVHLMLTLAPLALSAQAQATRAPEPRPAISGMRAYLFHNKSGALSDEDILGPSKPALWNTVAGPDAAASTLVVIEVSGPAGAAFNGSVSPETRYVVRLVAREEPGKVLLDQRQVIPVLGEEGKVSLAFLLHQNGCVPVRLTASIVGRRSAPSLQRSVYFACGE